MQKKMNYENALNTLNEMLALVNKTAKDGWAREDHDNLALLYGEVEDVIHKLEGKSKIEVEIRGGTKPTIYSNFIEAGYLSGRTFHTHQGRNQLLKVIGKVKRLIENPAPPAKESSKRIDKIINTLEGDGPIQKHTLLLKLKNALETSPNFGDKPVMEVNSPQRIWLSEVGALLSRLSIQRKLAYQRSFDALTHAWVEAINEIKGHVLDAIEEIKLELELAGRSDIGSAYAPGETYKFFADLKDIIHQAEHEIIIIDPYFNGKAFDEYLSTVKKGLNIRILADQYLKEIHEYAEKHKEQFDTKIELRKSKELHDRIIFIDGTIGWVMGGSVKDAGKKATYLIPLDTQIVASKRSIYEKIWEQSTESN